MCVFHRLRSIPSLFGITIRLNRGVLRVEIFRAFHDGFSRRSCRNVFSPPFYLPTLFLVRRVLERNASKIVSGESRFLDLSGLVIARSMENNHIARKKGENSWRIVTMEKREREIGSGSI